MLISPWLHKFFTRKLNFTEQPLLLASHPNSQFSGGSERGILLGTMESLYKAGYFMQVLLCITLFHNIAQGKTVLFPRRLWGTIFNNTAWSVLSKKAQLVPIFDSCQHQIPDRCRKVPQEATPRCAQRSFLPRSLAVRGWHKPQNMSWHPTDPILSLHVF